MMNRTLVEKIISQPDLRTLFRKGKHNILHYLKFPKRMRSVSRISMEIELGRLLRILSPGLVLDIGAEDAPYRKKVPATRYFTMDVTDKYGAHIVSDIHYIGCSTNTFDTVIATEVLEHCRDPRQAIMEIFRVLKPHGVCILTTRFIQGYHPNPNDYYRFTWDSLGDLFSSFSEVRIFHHGNTIQSIWTLLTSDGWRKYFSVLNPVVSRFHTGKTIHPLGFVVYAIK